MDPVGLTSAALLEDLKDPENRTAWQRYVDRYRPLVVRFLSQLGFGAEDAEDVAQSALMAFARSYLDGRYDPSKGRLRSWLFGIVHNEIRDWNRRRRDRELQPEDTRQEQGVFGDLESREGLEEAWESEWREAVLEACLTQTRSEVEPTTWRAFELFAREGWAAERVAEETGLSPNAVYGAKRRILKRVQETLPLLEDVW